MKKALLLMLACGFLISACGVSASPSAEVTASPTEILAPTDTPAPTKTPIPTPTIDARYFSEDFNNDLNNWMSYVSRSKAESDKLDFSVADGFLTFDLKSRNKSQGILLTYENQTYDDVRIDARFENKNKDVGTASLVCRYNGENWYGFYIDTNGFYYINYVYWNSDQTDARYQRLYNGFAKTFVSGVGVNEISAICEGNKLTFIVNGEVVQEVDETTFNLVSPGKAGISVLTSNGQNFDVGFDWVKISPASAGASVSVPEMTQATATSTPDQASASQFTSTDATSQPYANISADKAKFVFPMPVKEEWEWFVIPNNGRIWEEYSWYINFKTDKDYEFTFSILNYKNSPPQKGGLDEMLKAVNVEKLEDGNYYDINDPAHAFAYSISAENNNVVIELTGQAVASLYANQLASIFLSMGIVTDYSDPSKPVIDFKKFEDVKPTYE